MSSNSMMDQVQVEPDEAAKIPAIVVTGASSGIGREIARLAAHDGCPMLLIADQHVADIATELESRGCQAVGVTLDLQHADAIATIRQALAGRGWYCDVLVNSAGFGLFGAATEIDPQQQLALIDVNIRAVAALSLAFLPGMVARRRGGILNVGSITGYMPGPYMTAYFASKAFVQSFSASLAAEVGRFGVTVTCLTPGVVRTAFFERCAVAPSRLMKLIPRGNVNMVAKAGWDGFKAGKPVVVPRFGDRLVLFICWLLPNSVVARLAATMRPSGKM